MIRNVTPKQAHELLAARAVHVVDVRDPGEWATGHIAGATLCPLEQLRKNPNAALPDDNVLLVCAAGVRSQTAARVAAGLGLKNVYSLMGGTRGWAKAGYELVTDELAVAV
ncbi:rhodanese-like domain-containing protein [bacterium]|nr:MAG: rhodanese-like domain-containing protein [bacterium]